MKQHTVETFFTTAIAWTPFVAIRAVPPRDPDDDEEDEEDDEEEDDDEEPAVVREPDED
ncbi:hypothetical protein IVB38_18540 [Bradyrhizobium sp. 38]|jgi:hypothetical protein|uniref:hypothetical protein n=1 Tax=unclassified Bradyrhizobium TaxID=2631580 RepID=UPI001FFB03FD|nr:MULTISPECIES: hypothetical protein [unclassified Bradyrhizobium]MCK1337962.1 hypothetical protein [Bradyrhizobium sp. 38]MCK1780398.1 hypothetical protein [Bradyrhizobium sp. 132]